MHFPGNPSVLRSPFPMVSDRSWRGLMLGALGLATVLGVWGYSQHESQSGHEPHLLNALYHTVQLFMLKMPHLEESLPVPLEIARWLAPASTLAVGLTVFQRLLRQLIADLVLPFLRGHVIVCGLGEKGIRLVRYFRQPTPPCRRRTVVVVDRMPAPELAGECERLGAVIVSGNPEDPALLLQAGITRAADLFALCDADGTNCEIAAAASHLCARSTGATLDCRVHLGSVDARLALQEMVARHPTPGSASLRFIDAYDSEALRLLVHKLPLDHDGLRADDPRQAHLVIVGFGRMGRTLAVRAAQLGVFANGRRLRLSVIDRNALKHQDELLFHHPQIQDVVDLTFHPCEAASHDSRRLMAHWCAEPQTVTSVAICFDEEALALSVATGLLPVLAAGETRVAVRLASGSGMAALLSEAQRQLDSPHAARERGVSTPEGPAGDFRKLLGRMLIFGHESEPLDLADPEGGDMERFARAAHQTYVEQVLRQLELQGGTPEAMRQRTEAALRRVELLTWRDLPEDLRESNRLQAAHLQIKLRAVGCTMVPAHTTGTPVTSFGEDTELLARLEHERWLAERRIMNWKRASLKCPDRGETPNLLPWSELNEDLRTFDRATIKRTIETLQSLGLKVVRIPHL